MTFKELVKAELTGRGLTPDEADGMIKIAHERDQVGLDWNRETSELNGLFVVLFLHAVLAVASDNLPSGHPVKSKFTYTK